MILTGREMQEIKLQEGEVPPRYHAFHQHVSLGSQAPLPATPGHLQPLGSGARQAPAVNQQQQTLKLHIPDTAPSQDLLSSNNYDKSCKGITY